MVKSSVHWTREFPAGISGIPAVGRAPPQSWDPAQNSKPPPPHKIPKGFSRFFTNFLDPASSWDRLKMENWEFWGIFWEFCSFLGVSRGWERLFSHREFPGKIPGEFPQLSPDHSSPELGFFPNFSVFFPNFWGFGCPGSAQIQVGAAWFSGSVPAHGIGNHPKVFPAQNLGIWSQNSKLEPSWA